MNFILQFDLYAKKLRKQSDKKVGGQEGHEGKTLILSTTPDETVDEIPNYCTECGTSLDDTERILDYVTQVISIPELKLIVKQVNHYVLDCKKCGERIRTAPKKRSNNVVYDASVKSLVVYLSVVQFLPYGRIANIFKELFGITPSEG